MTYRALLATKPPRGVDDVRVLNGLRLTLLLAVFVVCAAVPAAADLTVISHYTLVNGDTLTRASYYSSRRVRVTAPDGREFMFNERGDSITVIDHTNRTYWTGPRSLADSLAKKIMARNREGVPEIATTDPVAWGKKIEAFNDSIQASSTFKSKMIAGYPCDQWILTAGSYLTHERWVARSLDVPNYGPEMQKAMMATIADPLGRQLMRMLVDMYSKDGLVLAASTQFRTLQRNGSYEFEAIGVDGKSLPKSTWLVPKGYRQIKL